jgi:very-short-patch-repair endonuclease
LAPEEHGSRTPVTSLMRTLADCARTLRLPQAVIILDSALRRRDVTIERLRALAASARGTGAGKLRRAVAHADALAGSALESRLRLLLELVSSDVRSQAPFDGVGDVDFLVDGWLTVEGDGYEFHRSRADYRNDRRRGNLLVVAGSPVLRFSWEDVFLWPWVVLAQVEAVRAQRVKQTSQV